MTERLPRPATESPDRRRGRATPATWRRPSGGSADADPAVRATALGALERLGVLDDDQLAAAFADPDAGVRRRAASSSPPRAPRRRPAPAARRRRPDRRRGGRVGLRRARGGRPTTCSTRSSGLAGGAGAGRDALVREAAVAALGAIGDDRGLDAILAGDDRQAGDPPPGRARAGPVRRPRPPPRRRGRRRARPGRSTTATGRSARPPRTSRRSVAGPPDRLQRSSGRRCVVVAAFEADALVQPVGGLARRAARQADVLGAAAAGLVEGGPVERLADARGRGRRRRRRRPRSTPSARSGCGTGRASGCRRCAVDAGDEQRRSRVDRRCPRSSSRPGGGDDDDSCGISRSKAATSSSVTRRRCSMSARHGCACIRRAPVPTPWRAARRVRRSRTPPARLGAVLEPVVGQVYFAPECHATYDALGFDAEHRRGRRRRRCPTGRPTSPAAAASSARCPARSWRPRSACSTRRPSCPSRRRSAGR